ncbi:MAG TPA: hypothetical protein VFK57_02205 [Vicinamibacterales bacterium]|nr:hypothetical protein [Vicinamibacterales bacterium]
MAAPRPFARLVAFGFAMTLAAVALVALRAPAVRASTPEEVTLAAGTSIHLATPAFLTVGKRYAFTWPGGGPPQTFVIKSKRGDGWVLVEVADENTRPELYIPGEFPTRWLHAALAVSIQEMRPLP